MRRVHPLRLARRARSDCQARRDGRTSLRDHQLPAGAQDSLSTEPRNLAARGERRPPAREQPVGRSGSVLSIPTTSNCSWSSSSTSRSVPTCQSVVGGDPGAGTQPHQVAWGFVADGRGGVHPLNDAADHWWRMGLDDGLKPANRRTVPPMALRDVRAADAGCKAVVHGVGGRRGTGGCQPPPPRRAGVQRWARALNIGASSRWEQQKWWKPAYYSELAHSITNNDPATGILLLGGPEEATLQRELLRAHSVFIDGGTDNSVADFTALIAACDWTLTGDSLGYHVACAIDTPAVCLSGRRLRGARRLRRELHRASTARLRRLLPAEAPAQRHLHGPADAGAGVDTRCRLAQGSAAAAPGGGVESLP